MSRIICRLYLLRHLYLAEQFCFLDADCLVVGHFGVLNLQLQYIWVISVFMSSISFMLSCVEHEKCFITSGPGVIPKQGKYLSDIFLSNALYFCTSCVPGSIVSPSDYENLLTVRWRVGSANSAAGLCKYKRKFF